jgi:hypothetical protein
MKLRIQGNSLRLRLSEQEVTQFAQTGRVEEVVAFGPGVEQSLHYVLVQREAIAAITVDFTGHTVMVCVSEPAAVAWATNSHSHLSAVVDNGTAPGLKILIEKDLDCRHEA